VSTPFIGEIRMFGGNFPPNGWAFCDGQLVPISENDALFTLIGTTYGGDGEETFALPNLQSRIPIHAGQGPGLTNRTLGETGGTETVTLTTQQMPSHNHGFLASTDFSNVNSPTGAVIAQQTIATTYRESGPAGGAFAANAIQPAGGGQPHENMNPFLAVNFIISLFGIFPTQN
jgi:microcystin-dependent protein